MIARHLRLAAQRDVPPVPVGGLLRYEPGP